MNKQGSSNSEYPRDLVGYANNPPNPNWPNQAKLAVQFVLNYEEGAESCALHGDEFSETFLSEIIGAKAYAARHMSMESVYDYGARAGFWRIVKLFKEYDVPITIFAVAMALMRNQRVCDYLKENDYDICSHGYRWIDHQFMSISEEREQIAKAMKVFKQNLGFHPKGWYTGRNSPNTRALVAEWNCISYDSDAYDDDLPYWTQVLLANNTSKKQLIIPYTLDVNDMRFATTQGFNTGEHFFQYLKDSFDCLYAEGQRAPKMMSIGMHCRLLGKPGRIIAMKRFLNYILKFNDVWLCRRCDIANHWYQHH